MIRKITCVAILVFVGISSSSAGQLYRGVKLKTVGVQDALGANKYFWVRTDSGPISHPDYSTPSCHTGPIDRVIWDLNDQASRAAMSLALAAYSTDKKIDIDAYNTCIDGSATVRNIYFSDPQ